MDSRDFLREAKIMKDLRHTNLIQLYAVGLWLNLNQIYAASKYTTLKILTEMNQVK